MQAVTKENHVQYINKPKSEWETISEIAREKVIIQLQHSIECFCLNLLETIKHLSEIDYQILLLAEQEDTQEKQIELYYKMQAELIKRAKYARAVGFTDDSDCIEYLSLRYWNIDRDIAALQNQERNEKNENQEQIQSYQREANVTS